MQNSLILKYRTLRLCYVIFLTGLFAILLKMQLLCNVDFIMCWTQTTRSMDCLLASWFFANMYCHQVYKKVENERRSSRVHSIAIMDVYNMSQLYAKVYYFPCCLCHTRRVAAILIQIYNWH
jgi:hypothetical protein